MTALPTLHGYTDVTPAELVTLVTTHKDDKVSVAYIGMDSETNKPIYTVRWKT